jgi:hypothetical protein
LELSGLLDGTGDLPVGGGWMTMILAPFRVDAPFHGIPAVLRSSEFAARVLEAVPGYHMTISRESFLFRIPLWQSTGALLPFFVHNMNNILARIMGNTELARMYSGRPDTANEKLDSAMAGVEDLRDFVLRLAELSAMSDSGTSWNSSRLVAMERTLSMFSGRSVDCGLTRSRDFPESLPLPAGRIELTVGLIAACAAMMVNGCGSIRLHATVESGDAVFGVEWKRRPGGTGLITDNRESSAELMATAVACCARFGLTLVLDRWDSEEGSAFVHTDGYSGKEKPDD